MKNNESVKRQDYGKIIYLFPFVAFVILLKLRDSESYGFIFEILPILGRTAPYFCLDVLLVGVFIFRGGTFRQLGLCWPQGNKKKINKFFLIIFWAIIILAIRIIFAIVLQPMLESFPEHQSNIKMDLLNDNFELLATLLPIMWIIVIGEEVLMRGLLMFYIVRVFGNTNKGWILAIIISSLLFGLFHSGRGPAAMIDSGFAGLVFGLGYYLRKNLWPVIIAHSAGNTLGFLGAYFGDDD